MPVLLFLLPLGLIFNLVGYMPPALNSFALYLLLALPLVLHPSRASARLGLILGVAIVLRGAFAMPELAVTFLFLLVHFAIWSVIAPVPRPLRMGVAAYAFLHVALFASPLGHPLVEAMTGLGNRSAEWIAGQPFHLGPTYQNLGAFLLFLTLSVFCWDGSRVALARTAGFLLVAGLVHALAAAVLIEKADFAAEFAWKLKFRDPFGFPELWSRLKGLGAIVFPAFVFIAQLVVFLLLHFGRTPRTTEDEPPAATGLRNELPFGPRALVIAAASVLAVLAFTPPTSWRRPAPCDLIFVERGVVSFTKPDYTRFGEYAGGMFGLLPDYARLFGSRAEVVKDIPATLDPSKTLVLTNIDEDLGEDTYKRIWDFVSRGGRLWVLGDHTFIKNGRNHLNDLLAPCHISFNNDSAEFFPQGWFNSYRFMQGTPFATLHDDAENRPGILVGASLELGSPAEPFIKGLYAYGDKGLDEPEGDRGYLGDFKYQPGERLGDLVLVAGERYGKGRVLVFGDTSSFFNNNLPRSQELLRSCLGWLGESNAWMAPSSRGGRWVAGLLLLGLLGLAFAWKSAPVGAAVLASGCAASILTHGSGGLPDFDANVARQHLAIIDYSHQPNASKHSTMDNGLHGLSINLMRYGALPIAANRWDPDLVELARYVVLVAPRDPPSSRERGQLRRMMESGGTVIVCCGFLDTPGSRGFLASYGCRIGDMPLGRFFDRQAFGQPISFMSAWRFDAVPDDAQVLCSYDQWPLIVSVPVGRGELIVIGDSEFLQNRNLEGQKNHDPANTTFVKNLLDFTGQ